MKVISGILISFIIGLTSILATPANILTPLIKKHLYKEARNQSLVDPTLFLNKTSYSGFITVDEKLNSNLFFWYFPLEGSQLNKPWIIWLQGGPGASSLAGLFNEIGPFAYSNDRVLKLQEWSWARDHSLLFIDNPVGAGYSFTDSPSGFVRDMTECSTHLYTFLRQFLTVFPELRKAPLYIAGESYAGRYIPPFATKILEQDRDIGLIDVNLKGLILGNPVITRDSIAGYSNIYYQWGLIDSQGLQAVRSVQDAYNRAIENGQSEAASLLREELLTRLDDMSMQQQTYNVLLDQIVVDQFVDFVRTPKISEALHVGNIKFSMFNLTAHKKLDGDFLGEVQSKVELLLNHYRILIYCGQLDLTAPCVENAKTRRQHWHWSHREQFLNASRTPWWHKDRVAGYVKSGGGLTEVLVRGAGHLAPMDRPEEITKLITNFIQDTQFELPPDYHIVSQDTPAFIDDEDEGISKAAYKVPGVDYDTGTKTAMVVSIVLNVFFILAIICGVVYAYHWKRRTDAFMYNSVDESSNIVSTMF